MRIFFVILALIFISGCTAVMDECTRLQYDLDKLVSEDYELNGTFGGIIENVEDECGGGNLGYGCWQRFKLQGLEKEATFEIQKKRGSIGIATNFCRNKSNLLADRFCI